jgi:hypothetical protein
VLDVVASAPDAVLALVIEVKFCTFHELSAEFMAVKSSTLPALEIAVKALVPPASATGSLVIVLIDVELETFTGAPTAGVSWLTCQVSGSTTALFVLVRTAMKPERPLILTLGKPAAAVMPDLTLRSVSRYGSRFVAPARLALRGVIEVVGVIKMR